MSERKEGYYWVQLRPLKDWVCAGWLEGAWEVVGSDYAYSDNDFSVIGPRIPTPDEPWQCVPVEPTREMQTAGCIYPDNYVDMLAAAPKP